MAINLEYYPLEYLYEHRAKDNPKQHDISSIIESIQRLGFISPIRFDTQLDQINAGNGRVEALKEMKDRGLSTPQFVQKREKEWQIPTFTGVSFNSDEEFNVALIGDNRTSELGGWDDKSLVQLLEQIYQEDDLSGSGFSEQEFNDLLAQFDREIDTPKVEEDHKTPEEEFQNELDEFEANPIRQIVIYVTAEQYSDLVNRMDVVMEQNELDSHTDVFLHILEYYENNASK